VLQFDPALSYGLVEYLRTLSMLEENGWSRQRCVPHGAPLSTTASARRVLAETSVPPPRVVFGRSIAASRTASFLSFNESKHARVFFRCRA
jgi:hypothetical protein